MQQQMSVEQMRQLLRPHEPPCVSIYQPRHRTVPDTYQDPIAFRNLARRAETELKLRWGSREIAPIVENLNRLAEHEAFWREQRDHLLIFASVHLFMVSPIQGEIPELVVVADNFHIRPLIRAIQGSEHYQVLCLTRRDVRLLEGNRDGIEEVPLRDTPRTMEEAFAQEIRAPRANTRGNADLASPPPSQHPHAGMPESGVIDVERFFRIVDHGVFTHHSRDSGMPLILCAVEENQGLFRKISAHHQLLERGIDKDPHSLSNDRIREEAWTLIEPHYQTVMQQAIDAFQSAKAHRYGSTDVREVAEASASGRVQTLLLDASKHIGGMIDPKSGQVWFGAMIDPQLDDLLDDTAEQVLKTGGQVMIIPPEMMPTDTGVAAIYRF